MDKDRKLAILAQILYLANLLAIPVIGLLLLFILLFVLRPYLDTFSRYHFKLALLTGSIALLLLGIPALSFWQLGYNSAEAWTTLLMYLIITHTTMVTFGIFALARAMTGKKLR